MDGGLIILTEDLIESVGTGEARRCCRLAKHVRGGHKRKALGGSYTAGDNGGSRRARVGHGEVGHQTAAPGTADALAERPLNADVRAVIARHLQEHDFDEDLGLGTVEVREHLADILGGSLVCDIYHPVRLRVDGEVGIPDGGVVGICPRGAAGATAAGAAATSSASPKAATAETATAETAASATAPCLGTDLKCQSHKKTEDAGEIQVPIYSLFDHICHVVSFSLFAVDPGCSHLEATSGTASRAASANCAGCPLSRGLRIARYALIQRAVLS